MKKIKRNRRQIKVLFTLLFNLLIVFGVTAQTQWVQKGSNINGEADDDNSGWAVSTSADGSIVAIGARGNEGSGFDIAGHVRVYQFVEDDWVQLGDDIDGEADGDESGVALSLSADGMTVAIGAYSNSGSAQYAGQVRVFHFDGTAWVQVGSDIDGEADDDRFGYSVSISADAQIVAIGAPYNDNNRGHVRVYTFSGDDWSQLGEDINGENAYDFSGNSVSLSADGSILAVGATSNDDSSRESGHVRVFQFSGTSWDQIGSDIDGEAENDNSGYSISLNSEGTILAISANASQGGGTYRGEVRVFENVSANWIQKGQDLNGDIDNCGFGHSVSLSGDGLTLAVGANGYSGTYVYSGRVIVFKFEETSWVQFANPIDGEAYGDNAGASVCLSSDAKVLALGAINSAAGGSYRGDVRVFYSCTENSGVDLQSACKSFIWIDGITYTESNNTATFIVTNVGGCDSIVTLNLTIETNDVSVTLNESTLTANAIGATYRWVDCDNNYAVIPDETSQSFTAATNGNYAIIVTKGHCTDTSVCTQITKVGVSENQTKTILIYPNPVLNELNIEFIGNTRKINFEILNSIGQVVFAGDLIDKTVIKTFDFTPGVYIIKLADGKIWKFRKIIKE